MRAMQCMQFRAKGAKNDFKPMNFFKSNFYFEMEGVPFWVMIRCLELSDTLEENVSYESPRLNNW